MDKYLFFIAFSVAAGGTILEMIAYMQFWPRYWRTGMVIYRRSHRFSRTQPIAAVLERLEREFPTYGAMQVRWKQLGENEIALVERRKPFQFGFTYSPVMRGLVLIDPMTQTVNVTGRLQWYFLLVMGAFSGAALMLGERSHMPWFLVGVFAVVALISYISQRVLYGRIANSLRDLLQAWD